MINNERVSQISILFSLILPLFIPCYPQKPFNTFTVSGIIVNYKAGKTLYLALYNSEKDFSKQNCFMKLRFFGDKLPADSLSYCFNDVTAGEYIVAAYQDLNDDGKINMTLFGPVEPYYIYKPNYGRFGPKFNKCKFFLNSNITDAHIIFKR